MEGFSGRYLCRKIYKLSSVTERKRTHHREYVLVLLNQALQNNRLSIVILQELLHLRGEVRGIRQPNGFYVHCFRKLDKVRVLVHSMRVPGVVEQVYICCVSRRVEE